MTINPDAITIEPGHCARNWQSCTYYAPGPDGRRVELFHERTFFRTLPRLTGNPRTHGSRTPAALLWLAGGPEMRSAQWLPCLLSRAEADALAARWTGATVEEDFYPVEGEPLRYFIAFHDTDRALAFLPVGGL